MTSPRNDSLQSLISKTSNYMLEILTDNNIAFNSAIDIPEDPIILRENIRNDAFLILKEALHNIIRHSGAKRVGFRAEVKENLCRITLTDDGNGFTESGTLSKGSHGNGLINMRKRARESEMDFILKTSEGEGTEIHIKFRI